MPHVDFRLYLVTDRHQTAGQDLVDVVGRSVAAGLPAIQVRERDLDTRSLQALTQRIKSLTHDGHPLVLINDRVDLAAAMQLDGVHLREASLPVAAARKILGAQALIGVSRHSVEGVVQAEQEGADFAVLGPIYDTPSKREWGRPLGVGVLDQASRRVKMPIFAIGGITIDRVRDVRHAGAFGVGVVAAILGADNIEQVTRELLDRARALR